MNRLTAYDRGDINAGHSAITSLAFAQDWELDQLNNWSGFDEDTNGNGTNDLVQDRTHNDANEITAITASTGANWVDPTYDGAGNMITGPTPGAETASQKSIYDAWNRLVKVTDGSNVTVLTYEYDARSFRITKGVYASGSLSQTRHYYHSDQNQVLEERVDASTNPNRQYTWGSRYIDDLVLRTRDTDANGSVDETVYALSDSNWSITALADASGAVQERFRYDPYGKPLVLDANFATDADGVSDYAWEYRFTSREWDVESKLHYFRARYDDAGGRFLQRDPIGYVDGMNLYDGYFVPSRIDPMGTEEIADFSHFWQGYWNQLNPWSGNAQPPVDWFDWWLQSNQQGSIVVGAIAGTAACGCGLAGTGGAGGAGAGGAGAGGAGAGGETVAQLLARYGLTKAALKGSVHTWLTGGPVPAQTAANINALLAYRALALKALADYACSHPSDVGTATQLARLKMIEDLLRQWGVPF